MAIAIIAIVAVVRTMTTSTNINAFAQEEPSKEQLQINCQHGACEKLQGTGDAFTIHSSGTPPLIVKPKIAGEP